MNISFTSLHQINHFENLIREIDTLQKGEILENYIERLMVEITESRSKRRFQFQRDTTEVRNALKNIADKEYKKGTDINAKRLMPIEQKAQKRIAHLGVKIQKGSLFQAVIEDDGQTSVIICKADHKEFLDENDFLLHKGLPWKERVFKAFLAVMDTTSNDVSEIYVYDTNPQMSKYWWEEYLELEEKLTDTHNTKTSLDILDRKIFNPIKSDYPADHTILRNSTIGYFRTKSEFEISDFINSIFENYCPIDNKLPLAKLKKNSSELPSKWNFDNRFTIKKEEIKRRAVNKIKLTEEIDLVLKNSIDLENGTIVALKDSEGEKYIKIRTDEGYRRFKKE